jgi:hypothetical protein
MQYSICSGIIIFATLIPIGAIAFNPKVVGGVPLEGEPPIQATRQVTSELKLEKPQCDGNLKPETARSFQHPKHEQTRNYDTDSSSDIASHGENKTTWGFAI